MEEKLNIAGLFTNEEELREVVKRRKICYETGPYYLPDRKGELVQIGYQVSLYGTFSDTDREVDVDSPEFETVEKDMRRLAEALSKTCGPHHMCESTTIEPGTLTFSQERRMRPDVTVNLQIFDQLHFGHPVDDNVSETLHFAIRALEEAGVRKTRWQD